MWLSLGSDKLKDVANTNREQLYQVLDQVSGDLVAASGSPLDSQLTELWLNAIIHKEDSTGVIELRCVDQLRCCERTRCCYISTRIGRLLKTRASYGSQVATVFGSLFVAE